MSENDWKDRNSSDSTFPKNRKIKKNQYSTLELLVRVCRSQQSKFNRPQFAHGIANFWQDAVRSQHDDSPSQSAVSLDLLATIFPVLPFHPSCPVEVTKMPAQRTYCNTLSVCGRCCCCVNSRHKDVFRCRKFVDQTAGEMPKDLQSKHGETCGAKIHLSLQTERCNGRTSFPILDVSSARSINLVID